VGKVVTGRVTGQTDFGVFVEAAPGIQGLVHRTRLAKLPGVGAELEVRILSIDPERRRLELAPSDFDPEAQAANVVGVALETGTGAVSTALGAGALGFKGWQDALAWKKKGDDGKLGAHDVMQAAGDLGQVVEPDGGVVRLFLQDVATFVLGEGPPGLGLADREERGAGRLGPLETGLTGAPWMRAAAVSVRSRTDDPTNTGMACTRRMSLE
jgi:hypothetical protein